MRYKSFRMQNSTYFFTDFEILDNSLMSSVTQGNAVQKTQPQIDADMRNDRSFPLSSICNLVPVMLIMFLMLTSNCL